jgi:hypothetical protein
VVQPPDITIPLGGYSRQHCNVLGENIQPHYNVGTWTGALSSFATSSHGIFIFIRDDLVVQGTGEVREASDCCTRIMLGAMDLADEIDRIFGHGFEDLNGILQSSAYTGDAGCESSTAAWGL